MQRVLLLSTVFAITLWPQSDAPPKSDVLDYRVDTDHPRLFLTRQRLRLLKRERERRSARWEQFQNLIVGKAAMPEPGLALALYAQVAEDRDAGRRAVDWALSPAADLRQQAIVYDWGQDWMAPAQKKALESRMAAALEKGSCSDIATCNARSLAAVALGDHVSGVPERTLQNVVESWWRAKVLPAIREGKPASPRLEETYALFEMLHAIRDNIKEDLREPAGEFFRDLPARLLLRYYPPTLAAPENDYHVPMYNGSGEPDPVASMRARAGEMAVVAFDNNSRETQFLQGWITQDRFILKSPYGVVYEFLWANPYQPGLSFFHLPLWLHDKRFGELYLRSAWEESADWFGFAGGQAQAVIEGKIKQLSLAPSGKPLVIGTSSVVVGSRRAAEIRFQFEGEPVVRHFIIGLEPRRVYQIEIDDEELAEDTTDPGGILELPEMSGRVAGVRVRPVEKVPPVTGGTSR